MQAGKLNRRIEIQSPVISQDTFGQPVTTWGTALCTWASIDIQNSALIYSTAEFMARVNYRITIRYPRDVAVSAKQRILYTDTMGTHTYEIQAVINDKAANKQLTLMAYELDGTE